MSATIESVSTAAVRFLAPMSLEKTYAVIIEEALMQVNGIYGSIVLPEGGRFKRVSTSSPKAYRTSIRKRAYAYRTYRDRVPFVVPITQIKSAHPELIDYGVKWSIFLPLSYENKSIGVLILHSTEEEPPSKDELDLLMLFGSLASLAIENKSLLQQKQSALELRDLFISIASHEFNTPLTTMYGYVQMLQRRITNPELKEFAWLGELTKETNRLREMVRNLLAVNKIKQGDFTFTFEPCNLFDILGHVRKSFGVLHPKRKLVFMNKLVRENVTLVCDENKLIQVFLNLLTNAAKFSPEESEIRLIVSETKNNIVVTVEDKGMGIREAEQHKVFQGFYKGPHQKKGMGIGLFTAKFFVDRHNGSIRVRSKEGKGASFIVNLPKMR